MDLPSSPATGPVAVVVVTHGNSGQSMVAAAERLVGKIPSLTVVAIEPREDRTLIGQHMRTAVDALAGEEVLFLVDSFGSTPARLCAESCAGRSVVLTGLNLAMLLKLATANRGQGASALAAELAATASKSIQVVGA